MTNIKRQTVLADLSLLLVAFIWGGGFIAGEVALKAYTPFYLLTFRFLPSGIILAILFIRKLLQASWISILSGSILGVLLFIGQTFQTIGLQYTSAGKQAFLVATYTVFVPFVSWSLQGKKPTYRVFISGILTLFGIGLLSLQNGLSFNIGDVFSLLFALAFALQIVLVSIYASKIDPFVLTTVQLSTAGILSLFSAWLFEPTLGTINSSSLIGVLYLTLINTTIAFLLQNIAQRHTSATHASLIISLEAIFGCLLSVLLLGEIFTNKMLLGSVIIFLAILLSKTNEFQRQLPNLSLQTKSENI